MHKVIISDDNALSIKGLLANIDFAALDVEVAGSFLSGMDALAYLRQNTDIDLIVSDIRMPNMTGLELAKEALAQNSLMKIVLISAYDDFEYAQEALRIGVFDYVQKPIQYDYLAEVIRKAIFDLETEKQLLRRLEEAQPMLLEKFYSDLLHSYPTLAVHSLEKQAEYLSIPVSGGSFMCVAVPRETDEQAPLKTSTERYMLQMLSRVDELRAFFGAHFRCRMVNEREFILAILHAPVLDNDAMLKEVTRLCMHYDASQNANQIRTCFGIGFPVDTLWLASRSMDGAVHALNRRYIFSDQNIFVEPLRGTGRYAFMARLSEVEAEVIRLLLLHNMDELMRLTRNLVASLKADLGDNMIIISFVHVLAMGVLSQFFGDSLDLSQSTKLLLEFGVRAHSILDEKGIYDFLMRLFTLIDEQLSASQQSHHKKLIESAKKYINDNLHDAQLRLENIASFIHVNPSHLSRIFKKVETINVSDYITAMRIHRAQNMLLTTDDSISLISEWVGYASPYYFSACFKKITGKTPTEYRKEHVSNQYQ